MRRPFTTVLLAIASILPAVVCAQTTAPSSPDSASSPVTVQDWVSTINSGQSDRVIEEMERRISQPSAQLTEKEMRYVLSRAYLKSATRGSSEAAIAVESFIKIAPNDERGAELLFRLGGVEKDPAKRIAIYQRVTESYAATDWAQHSRGAIRRIQSIGKPFELSFTDVLTAKPIDLQKDLKGKVVVVEFWAGWCSDCAAEMPRIKALYEKYKGQGVEFIGVSLDQPVADGGLATLKSAIARFGITWPQYYQGNYYKSDFSAGWGVNAIPAAFVVDRNGLLRSAEALPQLDKLIPELTAERYRD